MLLRSWQTLRLRSLSINLCHCLMTKTMFIMAKKWNIKISKKIIFLLCACLKIWALTSNKAISSFFDARATIVQEQKKMSPRWSWGWDWSLRKNNWKLLLLMASEEWNINEEENKPKINLIKCLLYSPYYFVISKLHVFSIWNQFDDVTTQGPYLKILHPHCLLRKMIIDAYNNVFNMDFSKPSFIFPWNFNQTETS